VGRRVLCPLKGDGEKVKKLEISSEGEFRSRLNLFRIKGNITGRRARKEGTSGDVPWNAEGKSICI